MSDDADLFEFFDDLEAEAEALAHRERVGDLADRGHSEYHEVPLAARLMASTGQELAIEVLGIGPVQGELVRVGPDWCAVQRGAVRWIIALDAVTVVRGASARAVPQVAWGPVDRLGLRSALRRLADSGQACTIHLRDGARIEAGVRRVGADFVEVATPSGEPMLLASRHLAALRHDS
ncbi:hypothetical protein [Nocardioides gilvus]|uniref:hypothetical protein n=1 Tax=Nocardioides gilvus TaxID=1735589 RepID=UPI000D743971|nr:hypothetical protein [Nocardioides gilvus]